MRINGGMYEMSKAPSLCRDCKKLAVENVGDEHPTTCLRYRKKAVQSITQCISEGGYKERKDESKETD